MCKNCLPKGQDKKTPQFTGVTPHVLLMAEMRDLNKKIKNLRDILGGIFDSVLYDRGIHSC